MVLSTGRDQTIRCWLDLSYSGHKDKDKDKDRNTPETVVRVGLSENLNTGCGSVTAPPAFQLLYRRAKGIEIDNDKTASNEHPKTIQRGLFNQM